MPGTRTLLVSIASAAILLAGCGPGIGSPAASGTGAAYAANPRLQTTAPPAAVPASAPALARQFAARWATVPWTAPEADAAIEIQVINVNATVFNAETPGGFTAFVTTRRTIVVSAESAAVVTASNAASPRFATRVDSALWEEAGRPSLTQASAAGQQQTIPASSYTFLPQGGILTYRQAMALPGTPGELAAEITAHLRAYAGPHPPASLMLRQLAFLIAMAPLTNRARSAAWQAAGSLAGLRICGPGAGPRRPRQVELCLASADHETEVGLDVDTASIVSVSDRLLQPSPLYPHVAAGTVVGSSTFVTA